MKKGNRVIVRKLESTPDAYFAHTASMEEWQSGQLNWGKALPVSYTVEGHLQEDLLVGKSCLVWVDKRNGVPACSLFQSSAVVNLDEKAFATLNSVYEILLVE